MTLLLLVACTDDSLVPLHFDGPIAAAWLPEDGAGPFDTPVGFVANQRNGTIVPLDLKEEHLLSDDREASFFRAAAIPTGRRRTLVDVAAYADEGTESITLWAADAGFQKLLQVPYVSGVDADGAPVDVEPTATDPTFYDEDASGDVPTLSSVAVRAGFTTTESWSIEYDGAVWWVKGDRSGTMTHHPSSGEDFQTDNGELEFTLQGTATAGDRFELSTDSGLVEWDFDGMPVSVDIDQGRVYSLVLSSPPRVFVQEPETGEYLGAVDLPADAEPWRAAFDDHGRMWVTDANAAVLYDLRFDLDPDPTTVEVDTLPIAAPATDVAWQAGEGADGVAFEHLFVAPAGLQRVDVYDLDAAAWLDPNPITSDIAGVPLGTTVTGLAPSVDSVWLQQETNWGALPRVPTIGVSTADGYLLQLDASTGCYVVDAQGPHGPYTSSDYDASYPWASLDDHGEQSDTSLYVDYFSLTYGDQVVTSQCGGVTRTEDWTLTYESAHDGWRVEGSVSGVQSTYAQENVRYVSDTGAISFLLVSGALPSTDGDQFTFATERGLASVLGVDTNDDGEIASGDIAFEFPARATGFDYRTGPEGGGWDEVDRREFMLLPVENSDLVAKVNLDKAKANTDWQ